jgi:hypothetical protein|tara:strand:- start:767 stop:910 length:144 start_codon:yes stop_codon:yes gene_type:complete
MEKCDKCGKPLLKETLEKCVNAVCESAIKAIGETKEKINGKINGLSI